MTARRLSDRPRQARRRHGLAGRPFALAAPARPLAAPARHRWRLRAARGAARAPGAGAARAAGARLSRLQPDHPAQGGGARRWSTARRRSRAGSARSTPSWSSPTARLSGDNTDGFGFLASLAAGCAGLAGRRRGRRCCSAPAARRARSRSRCSMPARPRCGCSTAPPTGPASSPRELDGPVVAVPWAARAAALAGAALLVNTTSLGMAGQPPLVLALDALPRTRAGHRRRLHAADHAAAGGRPGARQSGGRRPRHAAAPGAAGLSRLVRASIPRSTTSCARWCSRRPARPEAMIVARPHRLDRDGQVDRRARPSARSACRCSMPMPRCTACSRRAARRSPRSARRFRPARGDGGDRPRSGWAGVAFGDPAALARLEAILHPLVRAAERRFLARCRARRAGRWWCSTSRCCSRPAASAWSTPSRWSARPASCRRSACCAGRA